VIQTGFRNMVVIQTGFRNIAVVQTLFKNRAVIQTGFRNIAVIQTLFREYISRYITFCYTFRRTSAPSSCSPTFNCPILGTSTGCKHAL